MNTSNFIAVMAIVITLLTWIAYAPATNYTRIFTAGAGAGIALCIMILLITDNIKAIIKAIWKKYARTETR